MRTVGGSTGSALLTLVLAACGSQSSESEQPADPPGVDVTVGASGGSTGNRTPEPEGTSSTGDQPTTGSTGGSSGGDETAGPKFDVGGDTGGASDCDPSDPCCSGELQHRVLDAFLDAYPAPAAMPVTHEEVTSFEPVADGHAMAFNLDNTGNEFVDPTVGGVIDANLEAGREHARAFAEEIIPEAAVVLMTREDAPVVRELGDGDHGCVGVGWAWGSVLFEDLDQSVREVVYLYVGFCYQGDAEAFFYSDESVEICEAPG